MQKISSETFLRLFLASHFFHYILKCSLLREISDPPHLSQASILNPTGDLISGPELIKPFYPSLVVVSKAIWAAADPKSKSKSTPSSRPFCSFLSLNTATVQCYRTIMCCTVTTQLLNTYTSASWCLHTLLVCKINISSSYRVSQKNVANRILRATVHSPLEANYTSLEMNLSLNIFFWSFLT